MTNASVYIEGLVYVNGAEESFTFASDIDRDMEIGLNPNLTVQADENGAATRGTRVSIIVDTTNWFVDQNGTWLDPRDDSKKGEIENGIQSSLEAFEDNDQNGVVD